jgi:ferric-dicitrate binding protein FerR (iron transport regulator)
MEKKNQIESLLEKFLLGNCTTEETQMLYDYLNKTGDSKNIEQYLTSVWEQNPNSENINSEKIWAKINAVIETKRASEKRKGKFLLIQICKYAAIVLLSIGISRVLFPGHQLPAMGNGYNEFTVPYGSKSTLVLSDGTKVWLNSGSKFKYPDQFLTKERIVYLEGEAFFDVAHNPQRPFIVKTRGINVKAYGTKFNVKSFPEENIIETALVSGSVVVEKTDKLGNILKNMQMIPNQVVVYSLKQGEFNVKLSEENPIEKQSKQVDKTQKIRPIVPIEPEAIQLVTSWKDNKLNFKKEPLESLIIRMQRWYNVNITLTNDQIKNYTFTGTFDLETIEQALQALQLTFPFKFTIDKNNIEIK